MNKLTAEERSKIIKLTEKHCKQMLDLIYKQKMAYFKSGGDDWREVLERSYPRDPPTGKNCFSQFFLKKLISRIAIKYRHVFYFHLRQCFLIKMA